MDFGKDNILNAVNNWCSDKTRKLIPKFLKEAPDASQQFLAINTMYSIAHGKMNLKKRERRYYLFMTRKEKTS